MKNNFKKIIALCLALAFCFALAACGGGAAPAAPPPSAPAQAPGGSAPAPNPAAPAAPQAPAVDDKVYELTYATQNTSQSASYINLEKPFLDLVMAKSNGRINITMYTDGTLLKNGEAFNGMRDGVVDIAFDTPAAYAGQFPYSLLFEQSCAGPKTSAAACAVLWDFINEKASGLPEYAGVKPLMFANAGPACLVGNVAVRTAGDIKGIQVRTNATNAIAIERLGGTPVIMGMNDLYEAYSTNLLDSGWFVPEAMYGFSLYEVTKYATVWPFNQSIVFINMNQGVFDSLPADLQKVIDEAMEEYYNSVVLSYFDNNFWNFLDRAREANKNFEVIELSDADLSFVTDTLWPLVEEYATGLDKNGLDGTGMMKWMQERVAHHNAIFS